MSNFSTLKAAISAVIKENNNHEITGQVLQTTLLAMVDSLAGGYLFKGIATPATVVGTPDENVFYIGGGGVYSNFGATPVNVPDGCIGIFTYNGSFENHIIPTGGVFDISAYNAVGGTPATYANLTAAIGTGGANIPDYLRKGGMSVKFIQGSAQSSDNKYIQARLMADEFTTDISAWQVVDAEPTAGSKNLVEGGGVYGKYSVLSLFNDGHLNLQGNFVSSTYGKTSEYLLLPQNLSTLNLYNTQSQLGVFPSVCIYDADFNLLYVFYDENATADQGTSGTTTIDLTSLRKDAKYFRVRIVKTADVDATFDKKYYKMLALGLQQNAKLYRIPRWELRYLNQYGEVKTTTSVGSAVSPLMRIPNWLTTFTLFSIRQDYTNHFPALCVYDKNVQFLGAYYFTQDSGDKIGNYTVNVSGLPNGAVYFRVRTSKNISYIDVPLAAFFDNTNDLFAYESEANANMAKISERVSLATKQCGIYNSCQRLSGGTWLNNNGQAFPILEKHPAGVLHKIFVGTSEANHKFGIFIANPQTEVIKQRVDDIAADIYGYLNLFEHSVFVEEDDVIYLYTKETSKVYLFRDQYYGRCITGINTTPAFSAFGHDYNWHASAGIVILPSAQKKKLGYVKAYSANLGGVYTNWNYLGTWNSSNGGMTPSVMSAAAGMLCTRQFCSDQRYALYTLSLGSDTVLRTYVNRGTTLTQERQGILGDGGSCFECDFVNKKLKMYGMGADSASDTPSDSAWVTRYLTNTVVEEVTIPDSMLPATNEMRDYIIKVARVGLKHVYELKDLKSGESVQVTHTGWAVGRQLNCYGIHGVSGTPFVFKEFNVFVRQADIIISGDSIQEGVGVSDRTKTWKALLQAQTEANITLSACSGYTIEGILELVNSEFAIAAPKILVLTIGYNDLYSMTQQSQVDEWLPKLLYLVETIKNCGANVVLNCISLNNGSATDTFGVLIRYANTNILATDYEHMMFDVALAQDYDVSNDAATTIDGQAVFSHGHPSVIGHYKFWQRSNEDSNHISTLLNL